MLNNASLGWTLRVREANQSTWSEATCAKGAKRVSEGVRGKRVTGFEANLAQVGLAQAGNQKKAGQSLFFSEREEGGVAGFRTEAVEVTSVIPRSELRERVQKHAAEKGVLRFREETSVELRSIPCEQVQQQAVERKVGEQGGVIAVTETASQDRKLQKTVEQTLLDLVEAVKILPQKGISERVGEQFEVIEVSKNPSQESVKIILQKQMSGRTREQIELSKHPRLQPKTGVCSEQWAL